MLHWIFALCLWTVGQLQAQIVLQPHQQYTLNYLQEHPDQKGILLFHALGSGKTYLALSYAEQFPNEEVIVLLPRFLKSNWQTQMQSYGVKNPGRYRFIALQTAYEELKGKDLRHTIVIIDEVHKLVENIRYSKPTVGEKYGELYFQLQKAKKIIALTGTPIFTQASDLAYIGNLITGSSQFEFNPEKFKQTYMHVKPVTSLTRGYFFESKWMFTWVPFFITFTGVVLLAASSPILIPVVAIGGAAVIPIVNEQLPVHTVPFREFKPELLADFSRQYVSFYETKDDALLEYPTKEIHEERVHYTLEQVNFFLSFADEDLNEKELNTLLADSGDHYTKEYLELNSHSIQRAFLQNPVAGREIGNLPLQAPDGSLSEPDKFKEIEYKIRNIPGQVAVYSNYDKNGIRQFAAYLDRRGFSGQYVLLDPNATITQQTQDLESYNTQKKRILLIHPEITEGISLKATEQFHVLEPVSNIALLDQIIGRAVRFQSHIGLPEDRRKVKIFLWESYVNYKNFMIPTEAGYIRQRHWQHRYPEVNPSMWTKGILELDPNFFRKDEAPDTRVKRNQNQVSADMKSFYALVKEHSIETPQ